MAHRVISLRCGIWSLSGHGGHRRWGTASPQLQPRIFSRQISSMDAVARSRQFLRAPKDPDDCCGGIAIRAFRAHHRPPVHHNSDARERIRSALQVGACWAIRVH